MPTDRQQEPLDGELASLPQVDVDDATANHIRRLAHEVLDSQPGGLWGRLRGIYGRFEPVLVLGAGAVYLAWAVRTVSQIHH